MCDAFALNKSVDCTRKYFIIKDIVSEMKHVRLYFSNSHRVWKRKIKKKKKKTSLGLLFIPTHYKFRIVWLIYMYKRTNVHLKHVLSAILVLSFKPLIKVLIAFNFFLFSIQYLSAWKILISGTLNIWNLPSIKVHYHDPPPSVCLLKALYIKTTKHSLENQTLLIFLSLKLYALSQM